MTLIVEDGSVVPNANTYTGLSDARSRAEILGVTISDDDSTGNAQLKRAALFVDRKYRARFQGVKKDLDQSLQFPRWPVWVDDDYLDADEIPQELIDAQIYAAAQIEAGSTLYANSDGRSVASERVEGAVAVSYFDVGKVGSQTKFTDVEEAVKPLLKGGSKYTYTKII